VSASGQRSDDERLKDVLSFVTHHSAPFYREKYRRANFDAEGVRSIEDVSHIPLVTRGELVSCTLWDRAYLLPEDILTCGYTSGTTSSELFPVLRNFYIAEPPDIMSKKVLLLAAQPWRLVGQAEWFRRKKSLIVCGDLRNLPITAKLSSVVGIDCIYCTPTIALLVAPHLRRTMDIGAILTLVLSGESLSDTLLSAIRREFPAATVRTHYVFSEVGPLGFSCPRESGGTVFHEDKNFLYEIVDPDSGTPLSRGLEGELVITTLEKTPTPLIRYRTGDIGRLLPDRCACPKQRPVFHIVGRDRYDTVKVGGLELKASAFEKGMDNVAELVKFEELEVHIYEELDGSAVKPRLEFKIMTTRPLAAFEKEHVTHSLAHRTLVGEKTSLVDAERLGYLLPSRFGFVERAVDPPVDFKKKHLFVRHL